jgi:hypothetical protein
MNNVTVYNSLHPVVFARWSRDIQDTTRRFLAAKRPPSLPSFTSKQVLHFKHLDGSVAVMSAHDYMVKDLCLKNTRSRIVHRYTSIDALLADDWVLR